MNKKVQANDEKMRKKTKQAQKKFALLLSFFFY